MNQATQKHIAKKRSVGRSAEASDSILPSKVCKAMLLTVALGVGMLLVASLIAYFYKDPTSILPICGLAASALTAFFGGMIAGRLHGHSYLAVGLLNGIAMTLIMLPLSLFLRSASSHYPGWASALLHTAFLFLSALGAILTPQQKRPRKRRKK